MLRDEIETRLGDVARRAGLQGVPPAAMGAMLAIALLAVLWAAWRWWPAGGSAGGQVVVESGSTGDSQLATEATSSAARATGVIVHVAGAVNVPGVYELPQGSRVASAIAAAGGALPDAGLAAVNLARPLTDGEQILVPTEREIASAAGAGTVAKGVSAPAGQAVPGQPVNLNTADASALDALPGIGPATAQKIIAEREANGPFKDVKDLGRVSGIGEKKLEQLEGLVSAP